jgi:DNA replication and repair protein RecF
VKGDIVSSSSQGDEVEGEKLEVVLSDNGAQFLQKKYLVNGVAKRRVDFAGRLTAVLFTPIDLDIVSGQPSTRRNYLNEVLEQVDDDYRLAFSTYTKALRQRNALLEQVQKSGTRDEKLFEYWDNLLIKTGQIVAKKREELITYINAQQKNIFPFTLLYDKSVISKERLLQYKNAEVAAGVTLVGPHRDDVFVKAFHKESKDLEDVKYFSSRGQQRLVTLELKQLQISYIKDHSDAHPLLLLDDIFSELDSGHIAHVLAMIHDNQTIITTTHKEFLGQSGIKNMKVVELNKETKD